MNGFLQAVGYPAGVPIRWSQPVFNPQACHWLKILVRSQKSQLRLASHCGNEQVEL